MKDLVLLLVFLQTLMVRTSSLPYVADANRICPRSERYVTDSNLCCSRCPPGHKLKTECTESTDSVCEPCGPEQYLENWNFAINCLSCIKCKASKGLQEERSCSPTKRTKCRCMPDRYCVMSSNGQCQDCTAYKKCKKGFGVFVKGTDTSNVICKKCPEGTFSDIVSSTEACKNHSICDERHIISKGNATSDTVCKPAASNPYTKPETTTLPVTKRVKATTMKSQPFTKQISNYTHLLSSTAELPKVRKEEEPLDPGPDKQLATLFGSVAGVILLLIVVGLLLLCKRVFKKATVDFPKVDANGNCDTDSNNTNLCELRDTESLSIKAVQPEQLGLLENGDAYCIGNFNGQLQSTIPVYQPQSALSEPLPLQSNVDQVVSQTGTSLQSSSQPTSPQSMAPSPLVNVNINLHIGNGTCTSPAVMLSDTATAEPKIPFGEEEESCSLLQQEDGKHSLLSVEESGSYNNMSFKTLDQFV
ncbi:tumor necrosis factor receptor superfamily member 1B [Boleophthalmus pectinirostris]|uniref:tumor necrosis factor receptor superfamily member 1B n=1 Tax=Boleophthalmus pectinirostris TaxID=150288 RepID=UPI00242BC48E|nr:tumor necrosis factor receptor superfamily member 1B [Boleophthalmus pectinirostris]